MTLRSKLFATVALPVLSATLLVQPALAAGQQAPFEMAQAEDPAAAEEDNRINLIDTYVLTPVKPWVFF